MQQRLLIGAWAILLLSLAGCGTTQTARRPVAINGGTMSAMHESHTRERNALPLQPAQLQNSPRYAPMQACTYHSVHAPVMGPAAASRMSVTVRPVRDRYLITMINEHGTGTVLLGPGGRLHDFNIFDITTQSRFTSENYRRLAQQQQDKTESVSGAPADIINSVSAMFPEYIPAIRTPGSPAAFLPDARGVLWATYFYRGVTTHKGRAAAVLDLVRDVPGASGLPGDTVGFSVVELSTMMPLLVVVDAGFIFRMERVSCP